MRTKLPEKISTIEEAQAYLTELFNNNEHYHPDDDAHDIIWHVSDPPTPEECDQLNKLMVDIFNLTHFDQYEFLLNLMDNKS